MNGEATAMVDGTVRPGSSPGILTVSGSLVMGPTAALEIEIPESSLPKVLLPIFAGLGGIIILIGLMNVQFAPIVAGAFFIGFPLAIRAIDRKFPRTLTITREDLTLRNPRKKPNSVELVLPLSAIEGVHIERRGATRIRGSMVSGSLADKLAGRELVISTDHRDHRLGQGLDDESLTWLQDYIVSAMANA